MLDLVLIRHGQSTWNAENLFTGWVDVDLTPAGEAEARAGGELLAAADGPRPAGPAHLGPDPGHPDGRAGPGRRRAQLAPRPPGLAPQRAPLRGPAGEEQGRRQAGVRGRAAPALAPQLRHPAAAALPGQPLRRGRRPPLPRPRPGRAPPHRVPEGRRPARRALLGVRHRPRPARRRGRGWRRRARRRPRQLHPGPAQAPAGHRRRRDHRARGPDRHPLPHAPDDDLRVDSAEYLGDPEAAAAAAAAVARQADQPPG